MSKMYRSFKPFLTIWAFFFLFLPISVHAKSELSSREKTLAQEMAELSKLTFDDLMNLEITSVSKRTQKVSEAAAAIFVITSEDIRRSGVTSIPEALRMVPGLQVAKIDANKWAITSRGFNDRYANKLLVLMDGRSVYTPLYSGVYWDIQDTLLEDIERIEVIRGPGATLWGANAVNGVINIITRQAKDTQGVLVTAGTGTEERGFGAVRYGAKIGDDTYYRIYAKGFDRDNSVFASGKEADDSWQALRSGFRLEYKVSDRDSMTLQGDIYEGDAGQTLTSTDRASLSMQTFEDTIDVGGGNVLARWDHIFSDTSDMALQLYYDRTEREDAVLKEIRDAFDIDFQSSFGMGDRHEIVWGLGYRFTQDKIRNSFTISFDPDSSDDNLFSAFVQDEIILIEDRLRMVCGSKFEHNDYTGFEYQPSVRFLWTPKEDHRVWTAISRAVRTPSRANEDMRLNYVIYSVPFPPPPTTYVRSVSGYQDFESEELLAYEFGYRFLPTDRFFIDIAVFYNVYDNLKTNESKNRFSENGYLVIPSQMENRMDGETYGVEVTTNCDITDRWNLTVSYSYFQIQLHLDASSRSTAEDIYEGSSPHNQLCIKSELNLPYNLEFDQLLYYADSLSFQNANSYFRFDVRLGWHIVDDVDVSICGQNLFDDQHQEFEQGNGANFTEVESSIYGKITWSF